VNIGHKIEEDVDMNEALQLQERATERQTNKRKTFSGTTKKKQMGEGKYGADNNNYKVSF
jgi:hypothetical protein